MSAPAGPWRLVVADLDGTLVTGTSACMHLDGWIGRGPVVAGLERRLAAGELTSTEVAERYAPHYRGVAVAEAAAALASIPVLDDIASGVGLLAGRRVEAVVATISWSFAAEALAGPWGFTRVCGADLEVDGSTGRFTGRVLRHCAPEDKVTFAAEQCRRLGIGLDQVVAIGDGGSDLPLFRAVGFSVALNASPAARSVASVAVDGRSFLDALAAVPGLLDRPTR